MNHSQLGNPRVHWRSLVLLAAFVLATGALALFSLGGCRSIIGP